MHRTYLEIGIPLWPVCRWCMAVVSSCREMLG